ncbi:MAG TPA: GAF domain-containing protein [Anaerolineales bacterium]|nr:GAF domain-containing protein [Anaerolineales bacterium]
MNIISDDYSHDVDLEKIQGKYSPASVFSITIIGIAMAEVIAMVVVYFQRQLPYYQQVLIDAAVMTVIIFPLLYFLSFRPLLLHVRQRYQVERVLKSRLQIVQFADTHSLDELLKFTVDKLELLTESAVGYFHFVESDQRSISLQTWSTNTIQKMCDANLDESHYSLDDAGVWADCIRQRRVVVHNDYATLPHGKGLPDGHAPLIREMAIPIIRDEKIVAVFGVGNKPSNYNETDVDIVSTLADFSWDIINQKVSADTQRESEEKFRTLADWTYDWELWLDPYGQIIYNSLSSERITGYNVNEFAAEPDLLLGIVHPDDQEFCMEHHELIHDEKAGIEKVEYRIIDRGGSEHWIEHICRPVFGADNHYLGRRISNRDITQRKRAESELRERNKQERVLTQTIHTMQLDIARDLHDTIGQNIGYLRMKLEHLAENKSIKKADMQSEMQVMTMAANESYDLIRGTLAILQSGESSDLFRVFSRYAEQIEERSSIQVDFSINGDPRGLSAKRMRQLFYIFREALTNIEKHAQASQVSIRIDWDNDCLSLVISDNGEGFDPLNIQYGSHYGLKFMRERVELLNGLLDVQSTIGSGTKLVVQVPYE